MAPPRLVASSLLVGDETASALYSLLVGGEIARALYGTELQRKTGETLSSTINHQLIQSVIRRHIRTLLRIAP